MSKIINLAKNLLTEVKTYWKKPKAGEYISYKEFTNYIIGTSGFRGLEIILGYISFSAGCVLIGRIYELPMSFFAILGILGMPMSYLATPINMLITDNLGKFDKKRLMMLNLICIPLGIAGLALYFAPQEAFEHILPALPQVMATIITSSVFNIYYRMFILNKLAKKYGKFRPWIITGLIPYLVCFALIIYLPFGKMLLNDRFWILHLLFCYYNIFLSFSGQTGNIGNVISPNSDERAKLMSIGGFIFSLIPSLVGIILPILVVFTGNFENIRTYQVIFPVFVVLMSFMGLFLFFGVKEKVLISKEHKAKINFGDGAKLVLSNKNYLLINFSNLANGINQSALAMNFLLFIYVSRNSALFGIYTGIIGTACIPGLLMAPWLIKKFGKKKLVLFSRYISIASTLLTYLAVMINSIPLFIVINYFVTMTGMPAAISTNAMNADIWDELQVQSGQRLDGMTGIFGLLQTPIYALMGLVLPAIYLTMGFTSDWNILYVPSLRIPIINITFLFGAVASILGTIPFFFYSLTEKRHKEIIEQLKCIAASEGGLADDEFTERAKAESLLYSQSIGSSYDGNSSFDVSMPSEMAIDTVATKHDDETDK